MLCQGCVVLFADIANYNGVFMLHLYGKRQIQVENFPKTENVHVKTVQNIILLDKKKFVKLLPVVIQICIFHLM